LGERGRNAARATADVEQLAGAGKFANSTNGAASRLVQRPRKRS
jgi:hypothetical protein